MADKLKHYYLYLDESGKFEEDQDAPPSLIGGVFGEESAFSRKKARKLLEQMAENPDFKTAAGGTPLTVNHCVELPEEVRVPARLQVVRWCAEQGMEFVFFRSGVKVQIIDSTQTYLNLLAEGLAQFMAWLSYRDSAKLTICIGRRVDVAAYEKDPRMGKQSIPEEEYRKIIETRIAIAKARYLFDAASRISHEIVFDSDKENGFLVLSDYVCSCRYTMDYAQGRTRRDYEQPAEEGRSRRAVLEELFGARSRTFSFLEDRLQGDVRRELSRRHWGSALYLALSQGEPRRDMEEELREAFQPSRLDDQNQRTQMNVFFNLVSSLLSTPGCSGEAAKLLETYLSVLDRMPVGLDSLRSFCRINARLYLSAAYTHLGRAGIAKQQLDLCEDALPELLQQPENLELYYILRNRQAVVWQDCFRYDKALELLKEALAVAALQQESQENLFELLGYSTQCQPSVQQAKLQGSLALTCQYMLPSHPEMSGEAREAAEKAVEAMRLPRDRRRHHMTLAEVELRCGRPDEAYRQFCAGLDCSPDDLLEALGRCENPFDWYHAIRLADGLCRGSKEQRALAQALFGLLHSRFGTVFTQAYPAHSAARRMGALCLKLGKPKLAQEYFQKCESLCFQTGQDTLYAIGLAGLAERILADLRNGKPADTLKWQFRQHCASGEKRTQIPELKEFFARLSRESETCTDPKQFYQSVSDRVGH